MKEWYSAAELAGLPGMPGTPRGVNKIGERGEIKRQKKQKGKGWEYAFASLPKETSDYLRLQAGLEAVAEYVKAAEAMESPMLEAMEAEAQEKDEKRRRLKEQGLREFAKLPDGPKKRRLKARKFLLEALFDFRRKHGGTKEGSRQAFCDAVNGGETELPEWVHDYLPLRNGVRHLTEPTLERWEQAYHARGIMGLADRYGNRTGQGKIDQNPELKKVVLGAMFKYPHITSTKIKAWLETEHPALNIVSEAGIRRFMQRWKSENAMLWTYLTHPDQWKNIYMVAYGSHFDNVERLNQLWEMDSTPADWMLTDGRHSVIGVIDLFSRRLRFRVSKTSKAEAVCLTFRDAVLDWGVPEAVRTDNGKDYVSRHFDMVLRELEIQHQLCMPFASEQKGTIERAMRTMSHGVLDLLPGFIGHNVAERKVIEARKSFADRVMKKDEVVEVELSAAELQEKLDQWCEHIYGKDPHEGLEGRTPFQMALGQPVRRISDQHALDLLLVETEPRVVGKKGIRFEHHWYSAPELVAHTGREVRLRRDPDDLGRLYVYSDEGFICIAECDQLLGVSPAEKAAAAKAIQKRMMAEQKAELKEALQSVRRNPAEAILEHRIRESEKVTAFPAPSEAYTTPALEAAAEAAAARDCDEPSNGEVDPDRHAELVARFQREAEVVDLEDDPRYRHAYWTRVRDRIERGERVPQSMREQCAVYWASPEADSQQRVFESFGLTESDFPDRGTG